MCRYEPATAHAVHDELEPAEEPVAIDCSISAIHGIGKRARSEPTDVPACIIELFHAAMAAGVPTPELRT